MDEHAAGPRAGVAGAAGVASAALALAVAEWLAGVLGGGASLVAAVGDTIIRLAPGPVVALAIAVFGTANRIVLLGAMLTVAAAAGAAIGVRALHHPVTGPVGLGLFGALGTAAGWFDPSLPRTAALAAPALGVVVGSLGLRLLLDRMHAGEGREADGEDPAAPTLVWARGRRAVLVGALAATGAAALAIGTGRIVRRRTAQEAARTAVTLPEPVEPLPPPPAAASFDVDGLTSLVTPNDRFYRIDTAFAVPRIDPGAHTVRVHGLVERPFEIAYADLVALADTEADVTLCCVSNEVGGDLVGNARWFGLPLDRLLDRAGVAPAATQIVGRAVDGWTAGFPVAAAYDGRPALVAVGMNGEPLPEQHGFPVRLVVAGLYGYVSDTKWLSDLELTTFDAFDAYWIPRGWAREGPIKTQSRIDVPRPGSTLGPGPTAVAGVAWAGERGVARVEVAVDDGPWRVADLADELAPTSWRQWRTAWDATPGPHVVRVRATDGEGRTQPAEPVPPRPDGAEGHHSVRVTVT